MKRVLVAVLLVIFFVNISCAQENHLVLVHPTEYNLKLITYLIDQKIVEIDNLKITGVYHKNEVYDYSESEDFLANNNYPYINLKRIEEYIAPGELCIENNCTPIFTELVENSKGIFFLGGPDLPPSIYGEQMSLLTSMTDPHRHYMEASFLFHLLGGFQNSEFTPLLESNPYYVVYAICLGMQTMNIATGGTMVQDIPSEVYKLNFVEEVLASDYNQQHRNYNNNLYIDSTLFSGNFHEIKINNQLPIVGNYSENLRPLIYSNHHQAIEKLGEDLVVLATSVDGKIFEAIAHKKYPNVLGIQFHPEGTYLHDPEIKYRKNPNDELKSGKQILEENKSYDFHLEYWKNFSNLMNSKY